MSSEHGPIFFPITAAGLVKWPICLSRRTGHAPLVGMTGTEDRMGKEGGCSDADGPSGYLGDTVTFVRDATNAR